MNEYEFNSRAFISINTFDQTIQVNEFEENSSYKRLKCTWKTRALYEANNQALQMLINLASIKT